MNGLGLIALPQFMLSTTGASWALAVILLLLLLCTVFLWYSVRIHFAYAQQRESATQEIRTLAARLIQSHEEERRRLARELHDDLSQRLALFSLELDQLGRDLPGPLGVQDPRFQGLSSQIKSLASEMHRISHQLHPSKLQEVGLVASLQCFCQQVAHAHQIAVHFDHQNVPATILPDISLCLYRVAQEALQNVIKHSGAVHAHVRLVGRPDGLGLEIQDDGIGFESGPCQPKTSMGLVNMQERVWLVNGQIHFFTRPGQGTLVKAFVPCPSQSQEPLSDSPQPTPTLS